MIDTNIIWVSQEETLPAVTGDYLVFYWDEILERDMIGVAWYAVETETWSINGVRGYQEIDPDRWATFGHVFDTLHASVYAETEPPKEMFEDVPF